MLHLQYKSVTGYQVEKPLEVDFVSSRGNVYLRKDIQSVPNLDSEGNEVDGTHWVYQEAFMSVDDYQEYLAEIENPMLSTIMQTLTSIQLQLDELL